MANEDIVSAASDPVGAASFTGIQFVSRQVGKAQSQKGIQSVEHRTTQLPPIVGISSIVLTTEAVKTDHGQYYK